MQNTHDDTTNQGMAVASRTNTTAGSWDSLPEDIHLEILGLITKEKHRGCAYLASVSKAWRDVIAKKNFQQLKIKPSCLPDFEHMVAQNREFVQHIWLDIGLQQYSCHGSGTRENRDKETRPNNERICDAISSLLSILSTWKPTNKLTIEFSASSPSDSHHWFKNYCFGSDNENKFGIIPGDLGDQGQVINMCHDPKHRWFEGHHRHSPPKEAVLRLFGNITGLSDQLPQVRAVTTLMIRRQFRRRFSAPGLRLLVNSFPCLDQMIYEPWAFGDCFGSTGYTRSFGHLIESCLPESLRRLSIFEDDNADLAAALPSDASYANPPGSADGGLYTKLMIGRAFAGKSRNIEHLSVSFAIDAMHFFQQAEERWTWDHLESLALTSSRLGREEYDDDLLKEAAWVAMRMPKLHTMVLWYGAFAEACAFIYRRRNGCPSVTWRGTWDQPMTPEVVEAWEKVASHFGSHRLWVNKEEVTGHIGCRGDAIHYLNLPVVVADPVSLRQMRWEESWASLGSE